MRIFAVVIAVLLSLSLFYVLNQSKPNEQKAVNNLDNCFKSCMEHFEKKYGDNGEYMMACAMYASNECSKP